MASEVYALRSAQGADCKALVWAAFVPYIRRLGREPVDTLDWLSDAIDANRVYGMDADGTLAAVAIITRSDGEWMIDRLAVDPVRQRSGLGQKLLDAIVDLARREGVSAIRLVTAEMMDHLLVFYGRNGFLETHRALPTKGWDSHLRVHMRKNI